jgi:hypothetical protein
MIRFLEPEEIQPLLNRELISDLIPKLFDLHKKAPDIFVVCKRDLFEFLYKKSASPLEMYWAMVACKVAKKETLFGAASLFLDLEEFMPRPTCENPKCLCDDAKINQPQPESQHYQRVAEDVPSALEIKMYDV